MAGLEAIIHTDTHPSCATTAVHATFEEDVNSDSKLLQGHITHAQLAMPNWQARRPRMTAGTMHSTTAAPPTHPCCCTSPQPYACSCTYCTTRSRRSPATGWQPSALLYCSIQIYRDHLGHHCQKPTCHARSELGDVMDTIRATLLQATCFSRSDLQTAARTTTLSLPGQASVSRCHSHTARQPIMQS